MRPRIWGSVAQIPVKAGRVEFALRSCTAEVNGSISMSKLSKV